MLEIVSYSSGIEMVDYISLASRCCTFYHLSGTTLIQGYHPLHTPVFRICPYQFKFGIFSFLRWNIKVNSLGLCHRAHNSVNHDSFASGLFNGDPRTSERPSCTRCHVCLNTQSFTLRLHMAQHLHPAWRQIADIVGIISLYSIDGGYFHCSHTSLGILTQAPSKVGLIDSRSKPPPTQSWFCLARRRGKDTFCPCRANRHCK